MYEEGGVGEGRSRYVISPGGGNFECVSCPGCGGGGGGDSTLRFFWVYAACVSEPPPTPLYLGFDRLCSKKYIQQHSPIGLLLGSTPGVSLWLMAKREVVPT